MKVGLICPYDISKGGGVQEVVKALQAGLKARGHQALIIAPRPIGIKSAPPKGVVLVGLAKKVRALRTTAQVSLSFETKKLSKLLRKEQFDILHFHEPWVPVLSRQILSKADCPAVATFHAKLPPGPLVKLFAKIITPYTRSVLKRFYALSAVSPAAAEYARALTKRPIDIIPNGIDLDKYRSQSSDLRAQNPSSKLQALSSKSSQTILYVGRLEKRKGVSYLLKAFALAVTERPDLKLIIAGSGPEQARLERWAAKLPAGSVQFLGFVSEKKKLELLKSCQLFCSPALHGESFGIVLLEAMAAGAVVLAGDNPGYASVLTGAGRISLTNPKDSISFAHKLERLSSDPKARRQWLNWAAKEVKQYDWNKIIDDYQELYKKALE